MLLPVVNLWVDIQGLNSKNSSKPSSSDPNIEKTWRDKVRKIKAVNRVAKVITLTSWQTERRRK